MAGDRTGEVEDMVAERLIERRLHGYCRAVDRRDPGLLKGVFWSDASADYGVFAGNAHAFVDWLFAHFREGGMGVTMHSITNALIARTGDSAVVESQFTARHRIAIDGVDRAIVIGGRYHDLFARRGRDWRIARRQPILDWFTDDPARDWASHPLGLDPKIAALGRAGPDADECFARALDLVGMGTRPGGAETGVETGARDGGPVPQDLPRT